MSTGSAPIATSTPVNFAAGPVSPPPLALAACPSIPGHQESPVTSSTAKVTSYPAVLKGRTAASPPIPNLVPSGKIPPPVPPRGTGQSRAGRSSEDHRGPGTATSTSSMASSRGDEAAIITRYRLHESSSILHHLPTPDYISTSNVSAAPVVTTTATTTTTTSISANYYSTTFFSATAGIAATSSYVATTNVAEANPCSNNTASTTLTPTAVHIGDLHPRATTPANLPPRYDGLAIRDRIVEEARAIGEIHEERTPRHWNDWPAEDFYGGEDEEFVSVEKVDGSYFIRTSPYPFRPERGNFKQSREQSTSTNGQATSAVDERRSSRAERVAKFAYFLNPASRTEPMDYKMSRKDKKHSETYYERMKRKQMELEASISTITTLTRWSDRGSKVVDDGDGFEASSMGRSNVPVGRQERVTGEKRIDAQKFAERRKESKLLRKIREKSAHRRQKLAPVTSTRVQPFSGPMKSHDTRTAYRAASFTPNTIERTNDERSTMSTSDVRLSESRERQLVLKGGNKTFSITKAEGMVYSVERESERRNIDSKVNARSIARNTLEADRVNGEASNGSRRNYRPREQSKIGINEKSKIVKSFGTKVRGEYQERSFSSVSIPNASFLHSYKSRSKEN